MQPAAHRPLRIRLGRDNMLGADLLVQRIDVQEAIDVGILARVTCLSAQADLPLKEFIGQPLEIQIVAGRGTVRRICAIAVRAAIGRSNGNLTVYEFEAHDALRILEYRTNSRVFRGLSDLQIVELLATEWCQRSDGFAAAFSLAFQGIAPADYPPREFTHQYNESDAAFVRRLLARSGISWFFRPLQDSADLPAHEMVLFADSRQLEHHPGGNVHFHRDIATAAQDSLTGIVLGRDLVPGGVARSSWDYLRPAADQSREESPVAQGTVGTSMADLLQDRLTEVPHAADSPEDHARRTRLRAQRHAHAAKALHGEGNVRDLCVGQSIRIADHPLIDTHRAEERQYTVLSIRHFAQNNLKDDPDVGVHLLTGGDSRALDHDQRYRNTFTAVRRDTPIVPDWDAARDTPRVPPLTALVVGPEGEEVHTDALGRVRIRFAGYAPEDHAHAQGAGTSGTDRDSAWVRYASALAGNRYGADFIPRVGMEVLVQFLGGDPDKPLVAGIVHNAAHTPAAWTDVGGLPGNRYVTGIKTREVHGTGFHQLRYDDTPGQISLQWGTSYASTQLNAGYLTHPRQEGRGQPRGEGLEARTDGQFALRGARGVYLTAHGQQGAGGDMLERRALLGLAEQLQGIVRHLGDASGHHRAEATDAARIEKVVQQLRAWDGGTNVRQGTHDTAGGGAPMVAIDAPAGVAVASQDMLVLGAQTHIDAVSVGNTQLSAGRRLLLRTAEILSAFATQGMKLVTAEGKLQVEAHKEDIELTAAKRIVLTAGTEIVLQAPHIRYVARGTQVDHGEGRIVEQSTDHHHIVTPVFTVGGAGGGALHVDLPKSRGAFDQRVVMTDRATGDVLPRQRYRIEVEDGRVIEGTTDAHGRTEPFPSDTAFARYTIHPLKD